MRGAIEADAKEAVEVLLSKGADISLLNWKDITLQEVMERKPWLRELIEKYRP